MTRAAWPHMVKQKYGRILYTTSGTVVGNAGNAPYGAAKAACIGMMRSFAVEGAAHNILVNAISPAARTRMTERLQPSSYTDWFLKTMAPEKVAVGAAYLMSENCNLYGDTFAFGGGRVARMTFAETEGYMGPGESIEEIVDVIPRTLADTRFHYFKDLNERSLKLADVMGFKGGADAKTSFSIPPSQKAR